MAKMSNKAASEAARALSRLGGSKGGRAPADRLTPEQRRGIASRAAVARGGSAPPAARSARGRRRVGPGQYRGHLNADDFAYGWYLCSFNARSLFDDALLLHECGRHQRATMLALLAVEEAAKPALLLHVFLARNDPGARSDAWDKFRSHELKSEWHWEMLARRPEHLNLLESNGTSPGEVAAFSSATRERVTYVDRLDGRLNWSAPQGLGTEAFSCTVLRGAFLFLREGWRPLNKVQQIIPEYSAERPMLSDWPRLARHLGRWLATEAGLQLVSKEDALFEEWKRVTEAKLVALRPASKEPAEDTLG